MSQVPEETVRHDLTAPWLDKGTTLGAPSAGIMSSTSRATPSGPHVNDPLPLASAPEDMIAQAVFYPEEKTHFIQQVLTIKVPLSSVLVEQSFQILAERNQILRTSFVRTNTAGVQVVHNRSEVPVLYEDWRNLSAIEREQRLAQVIARDAREGFPYSSPIALRVFMATIANDYHQLLLSFNYCAIDGWSMGLLTQEWQLIYAALSHDREMPPNSKPCYPDYLEWLMSRDLRQARLFWKSELRTPDSTRFLATKLSKHPRDASGSAKASLQLGVDLTRNIRRVARQHDCTENVVFQCAWAMVLATLTGQKDVCFGAAFTGRSVPFKDVESMLGFTVNFLPIRMRLDEYPVFADLLRATQTKQHKLVEFEYVSLSKIHRWCNLRKGQTLFESILYFQNLSGLLKQQVGFFHADVPYPLRIDIFPSVEHIGTSVHASYRLKHFEHLEIVAILDQYYTVLCNLSQSNARL